MSSKHGPHSPGAFEIPVREGLPHHPHADRLPKTVLDGKKPEPPKPASASSIRPLVYACLFFQVLSFFLLLAMNFRLSVPVVPVSEKVRQVRETNQSTWEELVKIRQMLPDYVK